MIWWLYIITLATKTGPRSHLFSNGFGYNWEKQNVINEQLFLAEYLARLKDQLVRMWPTRCSENVKLSSYIYYKKDFLVEPYITAIDIHVNNLRKWFACFRSSLMIEKGRHLNIPRDLRFCFYFVYIWKWISFCNVLFTIQFIKTYVFTI